MKSQLLDLLHAYLRKDIEIEFINEWIALHLWHLPEDEKDLVEQVVIELGYVNDGHSNERQFHCRIAEIVAPTILIPANERPQDFSTAASTDVDEVDLSLNLGPPPRQVEDLVLDLVF